MDQQTQIVLAAVGGALVAGVFAFVWHARVAAKQAAKRRYNPQREVRETEPKCNCKTGGNCECPPYVPSQCIPARISVPDRTPVAIFGVRADGECGDDGRLSQSQVQSIVDRAHKLRAIQQDADLDELLQRLGRADRDKA
jgi:hypothetical protein